MINDFDSQANWDLNKNKMKLKNQLDLRIQWTLHVHFEFANKIHISMINIFQFMHFESYQIP